MSEEKLFALQEEEISTKKYTLQRVLDEKADKCLILLRYFNEPKWVKSEPIKKTQEYLDFKKRKQEILKEKSRKRKRSE